MSKQPESLDSAIRAKLDDDIELTPTELITFEQAVQVEDRFNGWVVALKKRFPLESEEKIRNRAADLACLNRRDRRRVFKHSSMKLPRLMKVPKGK